MISPDSTTDHVDNMEETWMKSLVEDCFARQTNTKPIYSPEELPIYSPERTFEAQGTTIFCQEDNGTSFLALELKIILSLQLYIFF